MAYAEKLSPPFDADRDITLGPRDGDIKLVWYVDYASRATHQVRELLRRTVDRFGPRNLTLTVRMAPSPTREPGSDIARHALPWRRRYKADSRP